MRQAASPSVPASITRFRPPGDLRELDANAVDGSKWHSYIQGNFSNAIESLKEDLKAQGTGAPGKPQFYDPSVEAPLTVEQDIVWNAFPRELLRRFGRDEALRIADTLWPLPAYQLGARYDPSAPLPSDADLRRVLNGEEPHPREFLYRPQTEYCEWHVQRDRSGRLRRVTFTCEAPEYWKALFGGSQSPPFVRFAGSPEAVLRLYRELVSPDVTAEDLLAYRSTLGNLAVSARRYNPYNRWNSVDGIAHLSAPPNALAPEIMLAAEATRLYENAAGDPVTQAEVLCACAPNLGNCNRNSDVAIVAAVNALARERRRVTLLDPVGICIDHIDLAGWTFPRGLSGKQCVRRVRGPEGAMLRLVVEVPSPELDLSDIRIGGVPIRFGGQIAECITVKVRAAATVARDVRNERRVLSGAAFVFPRGGETITTSPIDADNLPAFEHVIAPPAGGDAGAPTRARLGEPLLELDRIQGIAVPGYLKPHQTLLCVRHERGASALGKVKALLGDLSAEITTGRAALSDRQRFRRKEVEAKPLIAIGFTWPSLCALTPSAALMASPAFREGMAARSALLGDPTDRGRPGHPDNWVVGGRDLPDFIVIIGGDRREPVDQRASELTERILFADCTIVHRDDGNKIGSSGKNREHFGFVDGISQPAIRGRIGPAPDDFLTASLLAEWPGSALYGYPGQDLVWPGEFVLGYERSGPDPLRPGPVAQPELDWMRNGSYLVYSRLRQDVGAFWKAMRAEAARISRRPGFKKVTDEDLASRLVGRTRDGVPVSRLPRLQPGSEQALASNPAANNHFRFDSDTPRVRLTQGADDPHPPALADPLGMACPLAAHIRKVNPRDGASDVGGESANLRHRILRVGIPFGPQREDLKADPKAGEPERGQLFLCIQSSIEDQFEFLQARWMNDPMRPRSPGGHDMLAGRVPSNHAGGRRCVIFGTGGERQEVLAAEPFVTSSGGAYFFVPSLDAIRDVLSA